MQAVKLQVTVPQNREITLKLPDSVQPGDVEVLVLQVEQENGTNQDAHLTTAEVQAFETFMSGFVKKTNVSLPAWNVLRDAIYD